jgi:hypothetical protein
MCFENCFAECKKTLGNAECFYLALGKAASLPSVFFAE